MRRNGDGDYCIRPWKWLAGLLAALIVGFTSRHAWDYSARQAMREHMYAPGHPVLVERVDRIEQDLSHQLEDISQRLARIEAKLE